MYRINLHPEFEAGKAATRQRAVLTGLAVALLGAEALLVGGLLLSASLLDERVEAAREATSRLEARLQERPALPARDLALGRAILQVRSGRIDWSPKLAAVGERIGPQLVLEELKGRAAGTRAGAELEMTGRFRSSGNDFEAADRFVGELRQDERFAGVFPRCDLQNVGGRGSGFTVVCRPAEEQQ